MGNLAEELVDHQLETQVQLPPNVVLKREGLPQQWYVLCPILPSSYLYTEINLFYPL